MKHVSGMFKAIVFEGSCSELGRNAVVEVLRDGAGNSDMKCELPFSWAINRWSNVLKGVVMGDPRPATRFSAAITAAHPVMLQVVVNDALRRALVTDLVAMLHTPVGVDVKDGERRGDADELALIEQVLISEAREVSHLA